MRMLRRVNFKILNAVVERIAIFNMRAYKCVGMYENTWPFLKIRRGKGMVSIDDSTPAAQGFTVMMNTFHVFKSSHTHRHTYCICT